MRAVPGRDDAPLKYIIRANDLPDHTPGKEFFYDYVKNATLMGESFTINAEELHTLVVKLIAQNEEAESVIKVHEYKRDGRKDWKALKSHYEGIVIYLNGITNADLNLRTITYIGEKNPTTWWIDFERRICLVYQTYVKNEGRAVHSDQMKLRTFLEKVTCD